MFKFKRTPFRTLAGVKAAREVVTAMKADVTRYGEDANWFNPYRFWAILNPTGLDTFRLHSYLDNIHPTLDKFLATLDPAEVERREKRARFLNLDPEERRMVTLEEEHEDLKQRVKVVEETLGITI